MPSSDLRRLLWSKPQVQDAAFEDVEGRRIDKAEKNIAEALNSEDSRRRDAASFFVVRKKPRDSLIKRATPRDRGSTTAT